MARQSTQTRHVSLVALPDGVVSTLFGIFDVMKASSMMDLSNPGPSAHASFEVEIVGEAVGPLELASGVAVDVQRAIDTIDMSDVVIVPFRSARSSSPACVKSS